MDTVYNIFTHKSKHELQAPTQHINIPIFFMQTEKSIMLWFYTEIHFDILKKKEHIH